LSINSQYFSIEFYDYVSNSYTLWTYVNKLVYHFHVYPKSLMVHNHNTSYHIF
jgi:hypothetical protein